MAKIASADSVSIATVPEPAPLAPPTPLLMGSESETETRPTSASKRDDDELSDATDEEIKNLRHVVDKLPRKVWVALIASGAERFTYYVISTPWRKWWTQTDQRYC